MADKPKHDPRKTGAMGGRPTKYRSEYCQMLLDHMGKQGLSFESFAGVVGVDRDTLYAWESKFKAFSDAKRQGLQANLLFWEKLGNAGTAGQLPGFNQSAWNVNMKNRHNWREKVDVDARVEGTINLNASIVGIIEQYESDPGEDPEDC